MACLKWSFWKTGTSINFRKSVSPQVLLSKYHSGTQKGLVSQIPSKGNFSKSKFETSWTMYFKPSFSTNFSSLRNFSTGPTSIWKKNLPFSFQISGTSLLSTKELPSSLKSHFSALPLGVQDPTTVNLGLNQLRDNPGAKKKKRRIGRGQGSSKGKTAGRGMGGQNKRSGGGVRPGFESGQTQMYKRVRKYGFSNAQFKVEYERLNINRLLQFIDKKRIDPRKAITMKVLYDAGVFKKIGQGVKLLGAGSERLTIPLNLEVSSFSEKAKDAVIKAGGTCKRVYYNKLGLRFLLKPEKFDIAPKRARPPQDKQDKFDDWGQTSQLQEASA